MHPSLTLLLIGLVFPRPLCITISVPSPKFLITLIKCKRHPLLFEIRLRRYNWFDSITILITNYYNSWESHSVWFYSTASTDPWNGSLFCRHMSYVWYRLKHCHYYIIFVGACFSINKQFVQNYSVFCVLIYYILPYWNHKS